ncbi:MAG: hypothetical protein J5I59_08280 [Saprospiraceae bacterium]|nr:hypothetical protein [Saprospiraceae bacterium]
MFLRFGCAFLLLCCFFPAIAQMTDNGVTKYGNEWVKEGIDYYKIKVSHDGFYRIDYQTLQNAGLSGDITGGAIHLYKNGVELPIYVSNSGIWTNDDFLTFHGYYNKSEIDKYAFPNGVDDIVNPKASLYSDTAAYFLALDPSGAGLRVQSIENNLTNLPAPELYIIRISERDFKDIANSKTEYAGQHPYIKTPFYSGKGMVSGDENATYNLACPNLLPDSKFPIFRYRGVTNAGNVGINLGHDLNFNMNGQAMYRAFSPSPRVMYVNFSYVDSSRVITAGYNEYSVTGGHNLDKIRTGYIAIEYPAETTVDASQTMRFYLEGNTSDRYLELAFTGNPPSSPYLSDSLGSWRIAGVVEGNLIRFRIPASSVTAQYIYRPGDLTEVVTTLQKVKINTFSDFRHRYVILSHSLLLRNDNGPSAVEQYADYRRSTAGGSYDVVVVDVADLYNSFGYGLDFNPMAVKNFVNYLGTTGSTDFLFIIGRGRDYKELRGPGQLATAISRGYGVPTFGDFGSDNLMVSQSFHKLDMVLSVGRLPAVTQDEVLTYLNKIRVSDAAYNAPGDNESRQWTKTIVQVNGGNIGKSDQAAIADAQKEAEALIKSSKIAGYVETFVKGSNETIGKASDDFFKLVNSGVAVVDYFGHGALSTLEYPIDLPSKYNNSPRFPILIIKGCKTGNCQRDGSSYPSRLLYEDAYKTTGYRAVIGSIADSELYSLSSLARQFYTLWGGDMYGKSFGELFRATFNSAGLNTTDEGIQQLYIGDPALTIPPFPGPDYTVPPGDVKTIPESITSADNRFTVQFDIKNLGTTADAQDTLYYKVVYENGDKRTVASDSSFIVNPKSKNTVYVEFEIDKTSTTGENTIYIQLDPNNKIEESPSPAAEFNNEYINTAGGKGYRFFIQSSLLQQVYPFRFAIIDTNKVTLSGYSTSLQPIEHELHWALDTSASFDSPIALKYSGMYHSGHIEWSPNLLLNENTVYYWRLSRDSISPIEPALSSVSSFIYLPDKRGFSQSHNDQFREDILQNLKVEGGGNNIKFGSKKLNVKYTNGFVNAQNYEKISCLVNGTSFRSFQSQKDFGNYHDGLIGVSWFKRDSFFKAYYAGEAPFGSIPVPNVNVHFYLMYEANNADARKALVNYIENVIPQEDIIMLFTHVKEDYPTLHEQEWAADSITNGGKNIFNVLEKYGATKIRQLLTLGSKPYTIFFDKKNGLLGEDIVLDDGISTVEADFPAHSNYGSITQTFGPARKWDYFEYNPKEPQGPPDTLIYTLTAIHFDNPGLNYVIANNKLDENQYQKISLNEINADEFPYIRISVRNAEAVSYDAKMDGFEYFRLVGDEMPEATLLDNTVQSARDTINQGNRWTFKIKAKNISKVSMDSMLVAFSFRSQNGNSSYENIRFDSLRYSGEDSYSIDFDTKNLRGNYTFVCEMNPEEDQPEAYHGNNIYTKKVFIKGDVENPLVDVTFDGRRIINGDIVSTKPLIKIFIRDENQLFPLDDPGLFNVFLVNTFGQDTLIPMTSSDIKFIPPNPSQQPFENKAVIEYNPDFQKYPDGYNQDGEYTLRITATDKAGNQSGKYDFEKSFRIIQKKSVSDVFNYPNPFSNATRFVFTLTGYELPTYYAIQIMTVSGKMIREITQDELGPLRIGKQMTEYIWDGTDQYGDKLANGVYLYRFVVKDQDKKDYEKLEEGQQTGQYFDGQWGKLVIIR